MPLDVAGKRLSNGDVAVGGGAAVALIASFLPWTTYTQTLQPAFGIPGGTSSNSVNAFGGWSGGLFFLVLLVVLVLFAVRWFGWEGLPALTVADFKIYAGAGAVMVLLALLFIPTTSNSDSYLNGTLSSSTGAGLIIALLAALAICVGGYLKREDSQPANQAPPPAA
ncbi:MAG TPA: hypothetical protein VF137_07800 [Candidatus Dormibacteraeota bacterium]